VAYGVNDPVTAPPVTVMLVSVIAPTTENDDGCVQWVGTPTGAIQCMTKWDAGLTGGGKSVAPLKTVLQRLIVG
jgi:hypothetical protein